MRSILYIRNDILLLTSTMPLSLKQPVLITGLAALSKMMVTAIPHKLILPCRRLISRDTTPLFYFLTFRVTSIPSLPSSVYS
jgi:hypothetical protein